MTTYLVDFGGMAARWTALNIHKRDKLTVKQKRHSQVQVDHCHFHSPEKEALEFAPKPIPMV
jgi:hypothetical protein